MTVCDVCGEDVRLEEGDGMHGDRIDYCPNCGEVHATYPARG